MSSTDPYARVAAAYDAELDHAEGDVAGYASRGEGGPLLVLGAGTGRVSGRLAEVRPVTGLDRSADMLARARARGPASVRYVQADMTDFDLGPFAEVIAPNAAFAFLPNRAARAACLACCRRALSKGGPLTLDLLVPSTLVGDAHVPERLAWEGVADGRPTRRLREVFREPVAQRIRLVDRFWVDDTLYAESVLLLHVFSRDEVEWMLEANGFYVDEVLGDHRGGPLREGSDRLLVRARPL